MRRMYSEKQIQEMGVEISQEQINALAVRKMTAPSSTTLTDEQIAMITDGVFIEGTFLGYKNLILGPAYEGGSNYNGIVIAGQYIGYYTINKETKLITIADPTNRYLRLQSIYYINGKEIPAYPSSTGTFTIKCIDGVLTWVEEV